MYDVYWRCQQTKTIEIDFFSDDSSLNKVNYFHKKLMFHIKMKLIDREIFLQTIDIFLNWVNERKRIVFYQQIQRLKSKRTSIIILKKWNKLSKTSDHLISFVLKIQQRNVWYLIDKKYKIACDCEKYNSTIVWSIRYNFFF